MSKFIEDVKSSLQKGFSFTKVKAEEYGKIGKAKGVCKVQGEVVSEAAVTFMLVEG